MGLALHKKEAAEDRTVSKEGSMSAGQIRSNIHKGVKVQIVLKEDQRSGKLTSGVGKDILTNSANHPHGIKVRLESGEIGRVKEIIL